MAKRLAVGLAILLVLTAAGIWLLLRLGVVSVVANISSGSVDDSRADIGYVGVTAPGHSTVGAVREKDLYKPSEGHPAMLLDPGTRVKVIVSTSEDVQVLVLEGRQHGRTPWIHWEDLR
ncbi:MAG TPA: hypothetical protein VHE55_12070 [Fimbriimonadaceae bacterium]|nr:hypothetical protein [Fimbriimonadaceae bacterium]